MKKMRTWILVADGGNARCLNFPQSSKEAVTIEGQVYASHAEPTREIDADRAGRTFDSHGRGRHAIEQRVVAHNEQEHAFLANIVRQLDIAFEADAFDDLVVVAPPKPLGYLREIMPKRLRNRMRAEMQKDLVKHSDQDVSRLVLERLGPSLRKAS